MPFAPEAPDQCQGKALVALRALAQTVEAETRTIRPCSTNLPFVAIFWQPVVRPADWSSTARLSLALMPAG
jgi:hypothetical protein